MSATPHPSVGIWASPITVSGKTSPLSSGAVDKRLSSLSLSPLSFSCSANNEVTRVAQDESKMNVAEIKPVFRSPNDRWIHEQQLASLRDRLLEKNHQLCSAADLEASDEAERQRRMQLYPNGMKASDLRREELGAAQKHSKVLEAEMARVERLERHRLEAKKCNDQVTSVHLKPSELYVPGFRPHYHPYQGGLWETSPYLPGQPGYGFRQDGIPLGSGFIDYMRKHKVRLSARRVQADPMEGNRRHWVDRRLSKPDKSNSTSASKTSRKSRRLRFVRPMTEAQTKWYKIARDRILEKAKRARAESLMAKCEIILEFLDRP